MEPVHCQVALRFNDKIICVEKLIYIIVLLKRNITVTINLLHVSFFHRIFNFDTNKQASWWRWKTVALCIPKKRRGKQIGNVYWSKSLETWQWQTSWNRENGGFHWIFVFVVLTWNCKSEPISWIPSSIQNSSPTTLTRANCITPNQAPKFYMAGHKISHSPTFFLPLFSRLRWSSLTSVSNCYIRSINNYCV